MDKSKPDITKGKNRTCDINCLRSALLPAIFLEVDAIPETYGVEVKLDAGDAKRLPQETINSKLAPTVWSRFQIVNRLLLNKDKTVTWLRSHDVVWHVGHTD